jgi:hypothetical protein
MYPVLLLPLNTGFLSTYPFVNLCGGFHPDWENKSEQKEIAIKIFKIRIVFLINPSIINL